MSLTELKFQHASLSEIAILDLGSGGGCHAFMTLVPRRLWSLPPELLHIHS